LDIISIQQIVDQHASHRFNQGSRAVCVSKVQGGGPIRRKVLFDAARGARPGHELGVIGAGAEVCRKSEDKLQLGIYHGERTVRAKDKMNVASNPAKGLQRVKTSNAALRAAWQSPEGLGLCGPCNQSCKRSLQ